MVLYKQNLYKSELRFAPLFNLSSISFLEEMPPEAIKGFFISNNFINFFNISLDFCFNNSPLIPPEIPPNSP